MDQALSLWFLLGWIGGDSCNLIGSFLADQLPLQVRWPRRAGRGGLPRPAGGRPGLSFPLPLPAELCDSGQLPRAHQAASPLGSGPWAAVTLSAHSRCPALRKEVSRGKPGWHRSPGTVCPRGLAGSLHGSQAGPEPPHGHGPLLAWVSFCSVGTGVPSFRAGSPAGAWAGAWATASAGPAALADLHGRVLRLGGPGDADAVLLLQVQETPPSV